MEHKDHLYLSATLILQNTVKHNEVGERTSVEAKRDAKSCVLLLEEFSHLAPMYSSSMIPNSGAI